MSFISLNQVLSSRCCCLLLTLRPSVALQAYNTIPWLIKWLPGPHNTILSKVSEVVDFIKVKVDEHKENFNPSSPRDYIDCFLAEMGEASVLGRVCSLCRSE